MRSLSYDALFARLREATEEFHRSPNLTALHLAFRTLLEKVLGEDRFGIFQWDEDELHLNALTGSPQDWQSLGILSQREKVELLAKEAEPRKLTLEGKVWITVPFRRERLDSGLILFPAPQEWQVIAALVQHLSQLWLDHRRRLTLVEKNTEILAELNRSLHNLSVLRNVGEAVSQAHDLQHLLSLILRVAIRTMNAEKGFIMLEGEQSGSLELKVVHGLPNPQAEEKINAGLIKSARIPKGEGIQGKVLETRQPILLTEVSPELARLAGMPGAIASLMCVPLCMKDEAFGVIYITNKKSGPGFDGEDLNLLCVLAGHAASVIDQARLLNIASTDELTGLYTRRYYLQRIVDELKRAARYGRHLSLLVVDIDFFKKVNDDHGHQAGDLVLKSVSRILRSSIRNDVDFAVRFGGEEFLIVLPETDLPGAKVVAERIRQACETEKVETDKGNLSVTVSLGAAAFPDQGVHIEDIFHLADLALYHSKRNGRNRLTGADELPGPEVTPHHPDVSSA